jgi:hypothetical protein
MAGPGWVGAATVNRILEGDPSGVCHKMTGVGTGYAFEHPERS